MTELDRKVLDHFPGKVVRKDLTSLMKKGANVPTYVLEYLLGMYCAPDDEDAIQMGIEKIKCRQKGSKLCIVEYSKGINRAYIISSC